jgi:hypothetical protein
VSECKNLIELLKNPGSAKEVKLE